MDKKKMICLLKNFLEEKPAPDKHPFTFRKAKVALFLNCSVPLKKRGNSVSRKEGCRKEGWKYKEERPES